MADIVSNILNRFRKTAGSLFSDYSRRTGGDKGAPQDAAWEFVEGVMSRHYFTQGAQEWLKKNVNLRVDNLESKQGGGYWMPSVREVRLFTAQDEAAVHELAHAWWHDRRHGQEELMIEATVRLSADIRPEYARMSGLAHGYAHGIPEQGWEGLLVTCNDWEMFAGLASGSMGDMTLMPPYARKLYEGLFRQPDE